MPFLGEAVTVGFFFCTKEAPFRLTVMAIGGGGWVGIRLSPKGLVLLEMGLEAGASLSVNLGVASGSVSVMIGVYLRLEDTKGQLTGYFRIRGEVEVLGIASASITLELSLTYDSATGKLIGRATLTVEIEVAFFSAVRRDQRRAQTRRVRRATRRSRTSCRPTGRPGPVGPVLLVVRDRSLTWRPPA